MKRGIVRLFGGAFVLSLIAAPQTRADVYSYAVAKSIGYTQTSNSPPSQADSWLFTALLYYGTPNEVLWAKISFEMPPQVTYDLYQATETTHQYYSSFYLTEEELDLAYPSTTYTLTAERGNGPESGDVFLAAGLYPPEIPAFTLDTYDRLQAYDPALAFDGSVNAFLLTAGTDYGYSHVSIVEEGVGPAFSVVLTPEEFAFQVPAGLLLPATDYSIGVMHLNGVQTVDAGFGSADSFAEFSRGTIAYFTTLPAAAPCPGDLNGDKQVNQADLGIMLSAYGTCPGDPGYSSVAGLVAPEDPCVTQADLGVLLANYGVTCP